MKKLFLNCYELDKKCYENYHLSEDILMENAALGIANHIKKKFKHQNTILIAAGPGNNGADGVAAARILHNDFNVKLLLPMGVKSKMAKLQLKRAKTLGVKIAQNIEKCDIVIDALFGAGLNKALNDSNSDVIQKLNALNAFKIACDIPSGIDQNGNITTTTFKADLTFTMGALKTALYSDKAIDYTGKIKVVDLGIARQSYETKSNTFLLQKKDFLPPFRSQKNSHKGAFGHVNIFAGQKQGAALLCAQAAMRFGVGLVTVITNEHLELPPYLMKDTHTSHNASAIAIGMGLGNEYPDTFLKQEVVQKQTPIVLDADCFSNDLLLSILSQNKREIVLTPHPKEFSKLLQHLNQDANVAQIQANRVWYARNFSQEFPHVTLVLKGANTVIAKNGICYINPYASSNLSQAGSGDVLSGLTASLLAQGYGCKEAAIHASLALSFAALQYRGANFSMHAKDLIKNIIKL